MASVAASQHGLIRAQQARVLLSPSAYRHQIESGRLETVTPRVLRVVGSSPTQEQRSLAAVYDSWPAVLSIESAAAWWDLPGFFLEELHVTRFARGEFHESRLGTVHRPRKLTASQVTTHRGVPVTTPVRTLFDLAAWFPPGRVERAMDHAWSKRLVTMELLTVTLRELAQRGRTGIRLMRRLIQAREGIPPTDSGLERRFEQIVEDAGDRPFERQVQLGADGILARADFFDPRERIAVFIDGAAFHTALLDRDADDRQTRALEREGFTVLRFSPDDLWFRRTAVIDRIRAARGV